VAERAMRRDAFTGVLAVFLVARGL
jgi:hypothetical protein